MDIKEIIDELKDKRHRLDHVIRLLRGDVQPQPMLRRRGRTDEQRKAISDAMKEHWRKKRCEQAEQK